jgi:hypothetical protein
MSIRIPDGTVLANSADAWLFDDHSKEVRYVTHRAYHDRQMWRLSVASVCRKVARVIGRLADKVEPWHEDDEWYTPRVRVTVKSQVSFHSFHTDGPPRTVIQ